MKIYLNFWKRIRDRRGQSTASEYWCPLVISQLLIGLIPLVGGTTVYKDLYRMTQGGVEVPLAEYNLVMSLLGVMIILNIVMLIPLWATGVRRMHSIGLRGYWYFVIILVPELLEQGLQWLNLSETLLAVVTVFLFIAQIVVISLPAGLFSDRTDRSSAHSAG